MHFDGFSLRPERSFAILSCTDLAWCPVLAGRLPFCPMIDSSTPSRRGVVFVGSTRHEDPLSEGLHKKFALLREQLGPLVVVASSSDEHPRTFEAVGIRFILHARYARWKRLLGRLVWSVQQLVRLIAQGQVDVIVAQSPYEGVAGLIARRLTRAGSHVGLVVEVHSDFQKSAGARFGRAVGVLEQAVQPLFQAILRRADAVRVISNTTDAMVAQVAPEVPRFSFPAWTDMDAFVGTHRVRNPHLVLYAGVLTPLKNVHTLVDAFARVCPLHPQARLQLVGGEEDQAYVHQLRAQVERLCLSGRVEFAGPLAQSELAQRMAEATVLVLPSRSEGLGRVVFEAMATGTPVIGANVGGIPSMVTPGETGWLVDPDDESALAKALDAALSDPVRTRVLGENARAFARRFFSTEAYVDGMRRVIEVARARAEARTAS